MGINGFDVCVNDLGLLFELIGGFFFKNLGWCLIVIIFEVEWGCIMWLGFGREFCCIEGEKLGVDFLWWILVEIDCEIGNWFELELFVLFFDELLFCLMVIVVLIGLFLFSVIIMGVGWLIFMLFFVLKNREFLDDLCFWIGFMSFRFLYVYFMIGGVLIVFFCVFEVFGWIRKILFLMFECLCWFLDLLNVIKLVLLRGGVGSLLLLLLLFLNVVWRWGWGGRLILFFSEMRILFFLILIWFRLVLEFFVFLFLLLLDNLFIFVMFLFFLSFVLVVLIVFLLLFFFLLFGVDGGCSIMFGVFDEWNFSEVCFVEFVLFFLGVVSGLVWFYVFEDFNKKIYEKWLSVN